MLLNDSEPKPPAESHWRAGGTLLAGMLACFATFRIGMLISPPGNVVSHGGVATAVAIWLVLRFGPRMLFAVGIGQGLGMLAFELPVSATPAVGACLVPAQVFSAYLGALMFRIGTRFGRANLEEFDEPAGCLAAALVAPIVSVTAAVCIPIVYTGSPAGEIASDNWFGWWLGKAAGVFVVLPLLEAGPELWRRGRAASLRGVGFAVLLVGLLVAVAWFAVGSARMDGVLFGVFPLALLATVRFGAAGARGMAFLIAGAVTLAISSGRDVLPAEGFGSDPLIARGFVIVVALVALVLPALHRRCRLRSRPVALMLLGWAMGAVLFQTGQDERRRETEAAFSRLAGNAMESIERRLATYTDGLYGGVSFLLHAPSISRAEWIAFADTLNLPARYPGVNGMGVIYPVAAENREAFVAHARADQAPDFAIHAVPGGEASAGPELYVVTHVAPLAGNRPALGLDLASEAVRRRAAEAARDTGRAQITARVTLVQDSGGAPGFLLLVPVYRLGAPVATVAERRAALQAWVYAPFITHRFLHGVLGKRRERLELRFFDGDRTDASRLIYASGSVGEFPGKFDLVTALEFGGQRFTLGWNRGRDFVPAARPPLVVLALSAPLGVVLLVGWWAGLQTYRERAEEMVRRRTAELQASEERYRRMERGTSDGMWEWNIVTGEHYVAPRWREMLGHPLEDLLQDFGSFRALIHPDDRARVEQEYERSLEDGTPLRVEMRLRCGGGDYLWVVSRGVVERDAGGKPRLMTGTITDISERKRSERALRDNEQRFRTMIEWSPDAVLVHRHGRIVYVNPAAVALLGAGSADELAGKRVLEVTHPDSHAVVAERLANSSGGSGALPLVEMGFLRRDGSVVEVEIQSIPIFYDGTPAAELVARDVSARKRVEAALRESEVRLKLLIQASQVGLWDWNLDTNEVYFSPEWKQQLGYGNDELPDRYSEWETRLHPVDRAPTLAVITEFLEGRRPVFDPEFRLRHRDGSWRWILARADVTRDASGRPRRMMGCHIDLTARKLAEQAAMDSKAKLQTIFETMSEGVALNEIVYDERGEMIDYRILEVNRAFYSTADYRGRTVIGGLAREIYGMSAADIREFWIAHRNRTEVRHTEFQSPIGRRWYHVATSPFAGNRFVTSFIDITARKTAELSVQASLREKDALLKEVHHRVKNNLQVITSLLRLESGRSELPATREALGAMVGRIRSMAQLHEALYRSNDFSAVDLGAYLAKLATQAFRTLGAASGTVQLRPDLISVNVAMDLALPCGLLVNELLSNSLKHGFPAGRSGEVRIELKWADDGSCLRLCVSDTGIGLPANFAERKSRSLGLQLVGDLARQIGARLEIGAGPAAIFSVTFRATLSSG